MSDFKNIQEKLRGFIIKYYKNEIIKGSILFLAIGLLYFLITLLIEYFLWLKPLGRTILFWIFILVELGLCFSLIIIPLLRLLGINKGISKYEASVILGKHFTEIDDKLINLLQLNRNEEISELVLASIEQKSRELKPVPFKKAIDFKINIRYFKYLAIPVFMLMALFITGNKSIFTESLTRVVHHKIAYEPPSPFHFQILNSTFYIIEGETFRVEATTTGEFIPDNVKIIFDGEEYFMNEEGANNFYYNIDKRSKALNFHLLANGVRSRSYVLDLIKTPNIINIEMKLEFPLYTKKELEIVKNTGNANVPEGTKIEWIIRTKNTNKISFLTNSPKHRNTREPVIINLKSTEENIFKYRKLINEGVKYEIGSSNDKIQNHEKLHYELETIKDQFPKIFINTDLDSMSRGSVNFIGQISDDYGLSHLQVVAQRVMTKELNVHKLEIGNSDMENFYYVFPEGLDLKEGESYDIFFQVYDNDAINGPKMTKSKSFEYREKTDAEIQKELLLEQVEQMKQLENSSEQYRDLERDLNKFSNKLKKEDNTSWNNKKELEKFIERQQDYHKILEEKRNNLLNNLEEMTESENLDLLDKKEELEKRIQEMNELDEKERLLKELQELSEKLKNEDLLDKVEELQNQTKRQERSLERILELTKRFYVEKKVEQIIQELDELAVAQKNLAKENGADQEAQKKISQEFNKIQEKIDEMRKNNKELKKPMNIPETKSEENQIEKDLNKAEEKLGEAEINEEQEMQKMNAAKKSQNSAAKRMKEMKNKMKSQMAQMGAVGAEENIEDLEQILENLVVFSFDQETLMLSMEGIDSKNAGYPEKLKRQQSLKENFEHIDDSLFTLSLRLVQLSSKIDKFIEDAQYNLNKSLVSITDNKIQEGITHQRYTMTSANDLADLLSDLMENLKNKKPGSGQGAGKKGESIELPDIIKKQENILKSMKEGLNSQKDGKRSKEELSGEQFRIYQEQKELRDQLNNLIKMYGSTNERKEAERKMEAIEKMLLEKGINEQLIRSMEALNVQLLKLNNAQYKESYENRRVSEAGFENQHRKAVRRIKTEEKFIEQNEILFRNTFIMKPIYKEKVKDYFSKEY